MWPPLRSASVPSNTSIKNGISSAATNAAIRGSSVAPRLSELEIIAYRKPCSSSVASMPDRRSAP